MKPIDKYRINDDKIREQLEKKKVNIDGIREKYISGMSIYNIKVLYKINDEQFNFIVSNYVTQNMEKKRNVNIGKMNTISCITDSKSTKGRGDER